MLTKHVRSAIFLLLSLPFVLLLLTACVNAGPPENAMTLMVDTPTSTPRIISDSEKLESGMDIKNLPDKVSFEQASPTEPEHIEAQIALEQVIKRWGLKPENIREISYETKPKDDQNVTIIITFDLFDTFYSTLLEDNKYEFEARFIGDEWKIDGGNHRFKKSDAAKSTITAIEEGTREANAKAAAKAAEDYYKKVGGVIVHLPGTRDPEYKEDIPVFVLTDHHGNKNYIKAEYEYQDGEKVEVYVLIPARKQIFFITEAKTFRVIDNTAIYAVDLSEEHDVHLVAQAPRTVTRYNGVNKLIVSPDQESIAMVHDLGNKISLYSIAAGSLVEIWSQSQEGNANRDVGAVAWGPDSRSLYVVFNEWSDNTLEGELEKIFLGRISLDGAHEVEEVRDITALKQQSFPWDSLIITANSKEAFLNLPDSEARSGIVQLGLEEDNKSTFFIRDGEAICNLYLSSDESKLLFSQKNEVYVRNMESGKVSKFMDIPYSTLLLSKNHSFKTNSCLASSFMWAETFSSDAN